MPLQFYDAPNEIFQASTVLVAAVIGFFGIRLVYYYSIRDDLYPTTGMSAAMKLIKLLRVVSIIVLVLACILGSRLDSPIPNGASAGSSRAVNHSWWNLVRITIALLGCTSAFVFEVSPIFRLWVSHSRYRGKKSVLTICDHKRRWLLSYSCALSI